MSYAQDNFPKTLLSLFLFAQHFEIETQFLFFKMLISYFEMIIMIISSLAAISPCV